MTPLFSHVTWISPQSKSNILGLPTPTPAANSDLMSQMGFGVTVETATPDIYHIVTVTPVSNGTATPYPTYTALPTYTAPVVWAQASPTVTKIPFQPEQINWVFSYYNPQLVAEDEVKYGANCHPDNILRNKEGRAIGCKDTTASELPWSQWFMYEALNTNYRGGVAVPYFPNTYDPIYPMGTVLTVSSPSIMAGDYYVMDICPACDDYASTHNVLFLDFLARGLPEGVTFWDAVQVSNVRYPWE